MYYGLSLNVGNFGLDIYLTQFIFGMVELPARLGSLPLLQRLGRKKVQAAVLIFGGVACLALIAIPEGTLMKCLNINISCFYLTFIFRFLHVKARGFPNRDIPTKCNLCNCAIRMLILQTATAQNKNRAIKLGLFAHCQIFPSWSRSSP